MDDFNTLNTMFPTTTLIVDSSDDRSLAFVSPENTQDSPAPSVPVDSEAVAFPSFLTADPLRLSVYDRSPFLRIAILILASTNYLTFFTFRPSVTHRSLLAFVSRPTHFAVVSSSSIRWIFATVERASRTNSISVHVAPTRLSGPTTLLLSVDLPQKNQLDPPYHAIRKPLALLMDPRFALSHKERAQAHTTVSSFWQRSTSLLAIFERHIINNMVTLQVDLKPSPPLI
ncbi:hypothetical protein EV368DRAFT_82706 [Lentinula lateritia]|nr:hypothetical protein EV368DRAFT_82706 [Lentinula lateritia]